MLRATRGSLNSSILVCLIGNLRGGPEFWSTLILRVLRPLHADLGILGEQTHHEQTILFAAARFIWRVPEHRDWGVALDAFSGPPHEWRDFAAANHRSGLWGPAHLHNRRLGGSGAIIFVLRMYLIERLSAVQHEYMQIIVTRSDHYYLCDHPSLPVESIWVPRGENYPPFPSVRHHFKSSFSWRHCISERHVVFPSELTVHVLGVLPAFSERMGTRRSRKKKKRERGASTTATHSRLRLGAYPVQRFGVAIVLSVCGAFFFVPRAPV